MPTPAEIARSAIIGTPPDPTKRPEPVRLVSAFEEGDKRMQAEVTRAMLAEQALADLIETFASVSMPVFSTTAEGLAATTNGQIFATTSTNPDVVAVLYKNVSGSAVLQGEYPSVAALMEALSLVESVDSETVAWAIVDANDAFALAVMNDGSVRVPMLRAGTILSEGSSYTTPEAHGYGDGVTSDAAAISAAIATGKTVDLGANVYSTAVAFAACAASQKIIGAGARINTTANAPLFTHANNSEISGLSVVGSGKASGLTLQAVATIPAGVSGTLTDVRATNMGGAVVINANAAQQAGERISGVWRDCLIGYDSQARGEYLICHGLTIFRCGTGAKIMGGNNALIGANISNCDVGVEVLSGVNDAHGGLTGCLINHCGVPVRVNAITAKEFIFAACHIYYGAIELLGCEGVDFTSCGLGGAWSVVERGAKRCRFHGNVFLTMPTIAANDSGQPSQVSYYNNEFIPAIAADNDWRIPCAQSRVTRTTNQVVAAGAAADVVFNTVTKKALQANADFTAFELFNAAGYWNGKSFATPISDGRLDTDIAVTIGAAGTFDADKIDVYLSLRNGAGVEQGRRYFARTSEMIEGGNKVRVYTYAGSVPKYERMAVVVDNRGAAAVTVFADAAPARPSVGYVTGW